MFRFNIPIRKVDEERRLVYGLVTEEVVDQSGEILDYDTSKAYFQEWSDGISKATGGSSLGNLRLMHQPVVAGKIVELTFDDVTKQIACCAKIVSDDVWKLVLEGCLTGFSMGGKYIKRWQDTVVKGARRFTAKPVEVSVVDNPCVSTATFEFIKADGSTELRKFHTAGDGIKEDQSMFTQEQIAARAAELAKAAGTPDASDQFLDEALLTLEAEAEVEATKAFKPKEGEEEEDDKDEEGEEDEDADKDEEAEKSAALADAAKSLVQVWQAPDGKTFAKKAGAAAHVLAVPAESESVVEKALREARGDTPPANPLADLDSDLETAEKAFAGAVEHILPLTKGLYEVRELASVLQSMRGITSCATYEAKSEGDGSPLPAQLMELLRGLGQALIDMTMEEVSEMLALAGKDVSGMATMTGVGSVVELAARGDFEKFVAKAGARNSRTDMGRLQAIHDHLVELGVDCITEKSIVPDDTDLVKSLRADISSRDEEIQKAVGGIAALGAEIATLRDKVEKFGKMPQPLPPRSDHVVVERFGKSAEITADSIQKMSPDERSDLAIRLSQMNPVHVGGR